MTKNKRFIKAFKSWLSENSMRFALEPIPRKVIMKKACSLNIVFAGIAPEITTSAYGHGFGNICVSVTYKNDCWDFILDIDIAPKCNSAGDHYCNMCEPGKRRFYRSRQELLADHSFERFLEWVNENFIPSRWICLFGTEGITLAKIVDEKDVNQMRSEKYFVHAFPVIKDTTRCIKGGVP